MKVTFNLTLAKNMDPTYVHLNDPQCTPTYVDNSQTVLEYNLTQCAPTVQAADGYTTYSNRVYTKPKPTGVIVRSYKLVLPIVCKLPAVSFIG